MCPPNTFMFCCPYGANVTCAISWTFCLPSLLAPGNVPALSRLGRCTFVLLAPTRDAEVIKKSPLWALLLDCCSVRVTHIDDLISGSSSTVLTLAYALAIREMGEHGPETCFVPLVADYVVSDGSLFAAAERVYAGASGVLAGNFQVARETALPRLEKGKADTGVLAISPRSLMAISFDTLHRATIAEIVNVSRGLKPSTNRLFWRVDDCCMIGRFFLMHMIAIRPETSDFVIAAPSDYSLIPELCPTGEIVRMTDSDDYFVVECQPQDVVPQQQTTHPIEPRSVARELAFWATAMHRENARHTVIFHADGPSPCLSEAVIASDSFVEEIESFLETPPVPSRDHPIWSRALDYHLTTAELPQDLFRLAWITGDGSLAKRPSMASRLRAILLGRAPYFRPWHPRWPDVRMLELALAAARGDVAFVSDASARVRNWLDRMAFRRGCLSTQHYRPQDFLDATSNTGPTSGVQFDCVFLILNRPPEDLSKTLSPVAKHVGDGGLIVLCLGRLFSEIENNAGSTFMPISVGS